VTEVREALSQLGKEGDAALKLKLWRRLIVVMAYTRDTAMEEQLADTIAKVRHVAAKQRGEEKDRRHGYISPFSDGPTQAIFV
jgi:hypothetical protein